MQNQVQQRDLDSEEAVVKRMAATIARVLPSDTSATIAHTQGAQMLAAVKILMDSYVVST